MTVPSLANARCLMACPAARRLCRWRCATSRGSSAPGWQSTAWSRPPTQSSRLRSPAWRSLEELRRRTAGGNLALWQSPPAIPLPASNPHSLQRRVLKQRVQHLLELHLRQRASGPLWQAPPRFSHMPAAQTPVAAPRPGCLLALRKRAGLKPQTLTPAPARQAQQALALTPATQPLQALDPPRAALALFLARRLSTARTVPLAGGRGPALPLPSQQQQVPALLHAKLLRLVCDLVPARPLQAAPDPPLTPQLGTVHPSRLEKEQLRRAPALPPGQPSRQTSLQTPALLTVMVPLPAMQQLQRLRFSHLPVMPSRPRLPRRHGRAADPSATCTPLCLSSPGGARCRRRCCWIRAPGALTARRTRPAAAWSVPGTTATSGPACRLTTGAVTASAD